MNNYHLLMVHFPIALLMLYGSLEIISIKRLQALPYWFYVKAWLIVTGSLSAFVTLQTGDMIENQFKFVQNIVEVHSLFASITTGIFTGLAVLYLVEWIKVVRGARQWTNTFLNKLWMILVKLQTALYKRPIVFMAALAGLVAVTITGALGGSIAQGPNTDPVANFIYHLFFK